MTTKNLWFLTAREAKRFRAECADHSLATSVVTAVGNLNVRNVVNVRFIGRESGLVNLIAGTHRGG